MSKYQPESKPTQNTLKIMKMGQNAKTGEEPRGAVQARPAARARKAPRRCAGPAARVRVQGPAALAIQRRKFWVFKPSFCQIAPLFSSNQLHRILPSFYTI